MNSMIGGVLMDLKEALDRVLDLAEDADEKCPADIEAIGYLNKCQAHSTTQFFE